MNDLDSIDNLMAIEKALGREKFLDLVKQIAGDNASTETDAPTPPQRRQIKQEAESVLVPEVFISYSRQNWRPHVKSLAQHLYDADLKLWIDQHIIRSGGDWLDEINKALDQCKVLVLCVSPSSLNSRYVKMEYRYFLDENKPVLPIIIEETKLPAELRRIQHVDYGDHDDLIDAIRLLLD